MADTAPDTNDCVAPAEVITEGECNSTKDVATTETHENGCSGDAPTDACPAAPAVDTTEDENQTGTKRKCEDVLTADESTEEPKKQKVDEDTTTTATETTPETVTEEKENGSTVHTEEIKTNGTEDDSAPLPDEIVTKTVEDVKKLCEDPVDASS